MRDERPLRSVPRGIVILVLAGIALQITFHAAQPRTVPRAEQLPHPPTPGVVRALSFGDDIVVAKLAMLWLQSFDNQPGISIPFAELDYALVVQWLTLILRLDPGAQYPLLAASRIYAEVPDQAKQRVMLEFVEREFIRDPNVRWPWMAHAVYVAKHRIKDINLALHYAKTLAAHATGPAVPSWAQQMAIFVLEDMGELESAKVLLGGLIDGGEISDPHERWFLSQRLAELEARLAKTPNVE